MYLEDEIKEYWKKHRIEYNLSLIISGLLGFICYCYTGKALIPAPYFEVTIFSMFFQAIMYLILIGILILFIGF